MSMTLEQRNAKLDEAKALILNVGWTQDAYARDIGDTEIEGDYIVACKDAAVCYCARGAVLAAAELPGDHDSQHPCIRALEAAVKLMPGNYRHVVAFNDAPTRTVDEVAALFDKAKEMPL